MWRKCDLHIHLGSDDREQPRYTVEDVVAAAIAADLDVIAITDHDEMADVSDSRDDAAERGLLMIPGVELTTDCGHVLAYSPVGDGTEVLRALVNRVGASPGSTVEFDELMKVMSADSPGGLPSYRESVLLVGAHANTNGSILAGGQSGSFAVRVERAGRLDAIEVNSKELRRTWVKEGAASSGQHMPILQGSDAHDLAHVGRRHTWIHLAEVSLEGMLQGLATPEASLATENDPPATARFWIKSLEISDGLHAGIALDFSERINAIIGPPSIGKSLLVDALRFVFDDSCDIDEVRDVTDRRCSANLPSGTTVRVVLEADGDEIAIEREVGGEQSPEAPFKPIIFSQTELTRRAMATEPSMQLLDVHAEGLEDEYLRRESAAEELGSRAQEAVQLAALAKLLRATVENEVDGIDATDRKIDSLGASEKQARRAQSVETVIHWRSKTREKIGELSSGEPALPRLPQVPPVPEEDLDLVETWVPRDGLKELMDALPAAVKELVAEHRSQLLDELGDDDELVAERDAVDDELAEAAGADAGDLLNTLKTLRQRRAELAAKKSELDELDSDLKKARRGLKQHFAALDRADAAILDARKDACRRLNEAMGGFFCQCMDDADPASVEILGELRSNLRRQTLMDFVRDQPLDDLVDKVLDLIAGGADLEELRNESDPRVRLPARLAEDSSGDVLARLVVTRAEERLGIFYVGDGSKSSFDQLTEGMRALAIKEISFVSSVRPVISDQPEDSVPTRSVFDELVPTFQGQRHARQFIIVSHDANIVVGGDADRVIVLGSGQEPLAGTLFRPQVSTEALDHLEGGAEAFRRRGLRYSRGTEAHVP